MSNTDPQYSQGILLASPQSSSYRTALYPSLPGPNLRSFVSALRALSGHETFSALTNDYLDRFEFIDQQAMSPLRRCRALLDALEQPDAHQNLPLILKELRDLAIDVDSDDPNPWTTPKQISASPPRKFVFHRFLIHSVFCPYVTIASAGPLPPTLPTQRTSPVAFRLGDCCSFAPY